MLPRTALGMFRGKRPGRVTRFGRALCCAGSLRESGLLGNRHSQTTSTLAKLSPRAGIKRHSCGEAFFFQRGSPVARKPNGLIRVNSSAVTDKPGQVLDLFLKMLRSPKVSRVKHDEQNVVALDRAFGSRRAFAAAESPDESVEQQAKTEAFVAAHRED